MDISDFQATQADITAFHAGKSQRQEAKSKRSESVDSTQPRFDLPKPMGGRFIKGPIPLDWMKIASRCGRRGVELGLLLLYAAGWQKKSSVKFTSSIREELKIGEKTTKRILVQMQREGIIEVDFHRGRAPLVTLLPVKNPPPEPPVNA